MKAVWPVVLAALAAGSAPLSAQTNTTIFESVSGPDKVDSTTQAQDVRFRKDVHDRMTVPVRLSGTGPYQFLVDTGSDRTAVSRELAMRLGLPAGKTAQLHSVTGVTQVDTVRLPGIQLTTKPIRVADAPLLLSEHMGADGILGIDSLRSQRILFDFKNKRMTIVPSVKRVVPEEEGTIVVRAKERNGRLVLTHASADGVPLTIVLDTGSEVSLGNEALRQRLTARRMLRRSGKVNLMSVTGEQLVGDYMFLKKLDMGGVGLKDLAIVFADAHTFGQLDLEDRPALLLGMNAMRGFEKVSIDFAKKQLRVIVPETSGLDQAMMAARMLESR